jgi:hypothetical protein
VSIPLDCPACGRHLKVDVDHAGKRVRCPGCDSTVSVPEVATYGVELDLADVRIDSEEKRKKERAPRAAGPGDKECPNCHAGLPLKAVLCVDCGYDFRLGAQRETEYRLFERSWDGGVGMIWRIAGLGVLEFVLLLVSAIVAGIVGQLLLFPAVFIFGSVMFVLLSGTFPWLRLERTEQGKTLLTHTQWIGFLPTWSHTRDLKKFKRILLDHQAGFDFMGWMIFIAVMVLLLPLGLFPGLIWWYWAFTHPNFAVFLEGKNEQSVSVYHGWSDERMRDLAEMLQALTELPIERK